MVQSGNLSLPVPCCCFSRCIFFPHDLAGFSVFASIPVVGMGLFYFLLYKPDPQVQDLMHAWPISYTCAQQFYRLGGAVFWYLYAINTEKGFDSYFNLQTGVLDIFMGITAIPMAFYVYSKSNSNSLSDVKPLLWMWHAIGLYDLVFSFAAATADYFGIYKLHHPIGYLAFPPFTLICYYQVAWAMGIHILYLTSMDTIIHAQPTNSKQSQLVGRHRKRKRYKLLRVVL